MAFSLELIHYWRSSCSWRVRWALNLKKLNYRSTPVNLLKGEHKAPNHLTVNPMGQVPVLLVNGNPMRESLAIIEWLDEKFPSPPLLPTDPDSRAIVRELSYSIASGIQPVQNLAVLDYISHDPTERMRFARHFIESGLKAFEKKLVKTSGSFCFGGSVTMADLCLIPQVYNAIRFGIDITQFPLIRSISDKCLKLPECDAAAPQNQPGATK